MSYGACVSTLSLVGRVISVTRSALTLVPPTHSVSTARPRASSARVCVWSSAHWPRRVCVWSGSVSRCSRSMTSTAAVSDVSLTWIQPVTSSHVNSQQPLNRLTTPTHQTSSRSHRVTEGHKGSYEVTRIRVLNDYNTAVIITFDCSSFRPKVKIDEVDRSGTNVPGGHTGPHWVTRVSVFLWCCISQVTERRDELTLYRLVFIPLSQVFCIIALNTLPVHLQRRGREYGLWMGPGEVTLWLRCSLGGPTW